MRALLLLTAILGAGCASQSTTPLPTSAANRPSTTEAQRLRIARNLNLKAVDKDGQQVFCRSNYLTASRIAMDTTCYTADELEKLEERQRREVDQITNLPAAQPKNPFN